MALAFVLEGVQQCARIITVGRNLSKNVKGPRCNGNLNSTEDFAVPQQVVAIYKSLVRKRAAKRYTSFQRLRCWVSACSLFIHASAKVDKKQTYS